MKRLLPLVSKPVRYLGQEVHAARKDPAGVKLRFCLAFPDVYEVGMSHLGIQILYHLLNGKEGVACERVFAPWTDMESLLRAKGLPLASLESGTPLGEFDLLGFSLQYELSYTNVLNMLDLAGIPLLARDRDERFPLVIGGGPGAFNPAPVADFFDAFLVGDGEEAILELADLGLEGKAGGGEKGGRKKDELLRALARMEGVYVPALHPEGAPVRRRIVADLDTAAFPVCPIVPHMKVIHDRLSLEIARGCRRGCRFCQAGFVHRPYRERSPGRVEELVRQSLGKTGYEELSLLSLSAGDYSSIGPLLKSLMDRYESKKVAISFPSLRIESVMSELAEEVVRVRKTGFTVAPEAGTERLRRVINKDLDEAVFLKGVDTLFGRGWRTIKLYFMVGLPTEKEEDLKGILDLARRVSALGKGRKSHPTVAVSVSTFVPKPHTPFQWEPQVSFEEIQDRLRFLKEGLRKGPFKFKWQDPHLSVLEAVFSRGDRRLSRVLLEAHRLGCRFDGWTDRFRQDLWNQAFERAGVTPELFTRGRSFDEPLPWSLVDTGVRPDHLREEAERSRREETTAACREKECRRCGICDGDRIFLREASPMEVRPARGKPGEGRTRTKWLGQRIRLRFAKQGDLAFLSHLELIHLFHRAFRRLDLPIRYSEGFHPLPRIVFATALPVGMESLAEIVDVELESRRSILEIREKLNAILPRGIEVLDVAEVHLSTPPSSLAERSAYWIPLDHLVTPEEASVKVRAALESQELVILQEREGKQRSLDIRPLIERIEVREGPPARLSGRGVLPGSPEGWAGAGESQGWGLEIALRRGERGMAKPLEIVEHLLGIGKDALSGVKVVKFE